MVFDTNFMIGIVNIDQLKPFASEIKKINLSQEN